MGSFGVVMVPPSFDNNLGFPQRVEYLSVEQFISHSPVEAFAVSVLPGRSRLNVSRLGSHGFDPISDGLSNELRAIIRLNVGWHAPQDEQICQRVDDFGRVQLSFHSDRQTFSAVFIYDVQCPERPAIVSSVMNEVI